MSKLKQEVYKVVKKDETVLNGYDAENPQLEGAVFQCNFNALNYSTSDFLGSDGGTSIGAGDLVRWSFINGEGVEITKGFKAKRSYELVKSQNISVVDGDSSLGELLLFEDEESDLYKNGSKYFLRNFTVYGSVNLVSDTDFIKANDLIVADNLLKITTNSFRVGDVLSTLYTQNAPAILEDIPSTFVGSFTAVTFSTSLETTITSDAAGAAGNTVLTGDGTKTISELATEAGATVDVSQNETLGGAVLKFESTVELAGGNDAVASSFDGTFTAVEFGTSETTTITSNTEGAAGNVVLTGDGSSTIGALATAAGATVDVSSDETLDDVVLKSGSQVLVASGVDGTASTFTGTFTSVTFGTSAETNITSDTAGAAGNVVLTGDGVQTVTALSAAAGATVQSGDGALLLKKDSTINLLGGADATASTFTGTFLLTHPEGEEGSQGTSVTITADTAGAGNIVITGDGTSTIGALATAEGATVEEGGDADQIPHSGETITLSGGTDATTASFTGTFDTVTDATSSNVEISANTEGSGDIILTGDDSSTVATLATAAGATATGDGSTEVLKFNETITITGGTNATTATFTGTFDIRIESTSTVVSIVADVAGAGDVVLTGDDVKSIATLATESGATATGDATTEVLKSGETVTLTGGSDATTATFTGSFETRIETQVTDVTITANSNGPEEIVLTGDDVQTISELATASNATATGESLDAVLKAGSTVTLSGGREARKATFTGTFPVEGGGTSSAVTITMNFAGDEDVTLTGNGSTLAVLAADADATIESGDSSQVLATGSTIVLTGGDAPETELERSADVAFANHDGLRRFKGDSYFGVISGTSLVPDKTWFYFDGSSMLNGQITASQAENIGAGFFYNNSGDKLDFSNISAMGAFFVDQQTITQNAEAGTPIPSYVIAGDTGGTQVGFAFSSAINAAIGIDEYSEVIDTREYSNITVASRFWNSATAFDSPIQDINAETLVSTDVESLEIVDADVLTDPVYWDKISENFVEDYNTPVGSTGVIGAHPEGNYGSSVTPRAETDTYQTIEIVSRTNGTAVDNVTIETVIRHGIQIGETVTIGLSGFTGADAEAVNSANQVKAIDDKKLEIIGTEEKVVDIPVAGSYPILTKTNFTDIVWERVELSTTQQALIYKG